MSHNAYQATEEDVENVLSANWPDVANSNGRSFSSMAAALLPLLNLDLIERAALFGDDLDKQTTYANEEIARQLRERGVLEPLKQKAGQGTDDDMVQASNLQTNRDFQAPRLDGAADAAIGDHGTIPELDLSELDTVLDCAERHVKDIADGVNDGEFSQDEAHDLVGMQAAVDAVRTWHSHTSGRLVTTAHGTATERVNPPLGFKEHLATVDAATEALISCLDHSGALASENTQRAAYKLRLAVVQSLGDADRINAARQSLDELEHEHESDATELETSANGPQDQGPQFPDALLDPEFRRQMQGLADVTASINGVPSKRVVFSIDSKGSIGKHDWCVGYECAEGFPVFVDDRQLLYRGSIAQGREYALDVIGRLVADGDYRLNDKPAGFMPPPRSAADSRQDVDPVKEKAFVATLDGDMEGAQSPAQTGSEYVVTERPRG